MRKLLISLAVVITAAATPALANEARVEARTGAAFGAGGDTEAVIGGAVGYDFDLSETVFAGVEVSADKVLDSVTNRAMFGFTGRLGARHSDNDRLFAAAGYTTKPCSFCEDAIHLGAGWEHDFGPVYGKLEYRHFFARNGAIDADSVVGGLGIRF